MPASRDDSLGSEKFSHNEDVSTTSTPTASPSKIDSLLDRVEDTAQHVRKVSRLLENRQKARDQLNPKVEVQPLETYKLEELLAHAVQGIEEIAAHQQSLILLLKENEVLERRPGSKKGQDLMLFTAYPPSGSHKNGNTAFILKGDDNGFMLPKIAKEKFNKSQAAKGALTGLSDLLFLEEGEFDMTSTGSTKEGKKFQSKLKRSRSGDFPKYGAKPEFQTSQNNGTLAKPKSKNMLSISQNGGTRKK